jgi:hypothetical protein
MALLPIEIYPIKRRIVDKRDRVAYLIAEKRYKVLSLQWLAQP